MWTGGGAGAADVDGGGGAKAVCWMLLESSVERHMQIR